MRPSWSGSSGTSGSAPSSGAGCSESFARSGACSAEAPSAIDCRTATRGISSARLPGRQASLEAQRCRIRGPRRFQSTSIHIRLRRRRGTPRRSQGRLDGRRPRWGGRAQKRRREAAWTGSNPICVGRGEAPGPAGSWPDLLPTGSVHRSPTPCRSPSPARRRHGGITRADQGRAETPSRGGSASHAKRHDSSAIARRVCPCDGAAGVCWCLPCGRVPSAARGDRPR